MPDDEVMDDLILNDIDPEYMTELEKEITYDEMIEGNEGEC